MAEHASNDKKIELIRKARKQYGKLYPCAKKKRLRDSFTHHHDCLLFWFNTEDGSTRVVSDGKVTMKRIIEERKQELLRRGNINLIN